MHIEFERFNRRTKPHPGFRTIISFRRPVFWLAVILDCSLPSRVITVAVEQSRQAYSSGGCAGMAEVGTSRVTGLPVSPTGRQAGGHLLKRCRVLTIGAAVSSRCADFAVQGRMNRLTAAAQS